jgi:hypothetical protein
MGRGRGKGCLMWQGWGGGGHPRPYLSSGTFRKALSSSWRVPPRLLTAGVDMPRICCSCWAPRRARALRQGAVPSPCCCCCCHRWEVHAGCRRCGPDRQRDNPDTVVLLLKDASRWGVPLAATDGALAAAAARHTCAKLRLSIVTDANITPGCDWRVACCGFTARSRARRTAFLGATAPGAYKRVHASMITQHHPSIHPTAMASNASCPCDTSSALCDPARPANTEHPGLPH